MVGCDGEFGFEGFAEVFWEGGGIVPGSDVIAVEGLEDLGGAEGAQAFFGEDLFPVVDRDGPGRFHDEVPLINYFMEGRTMPRKMTRWQRRKIAAVGMEMTTKPAMTHQGWWAKVCDIWYIQTARVQWDSFWQTRKAHSQEA